MFFYKIRVNIKANVAADKGEKDDGLVIWRAPDEYSQEISECTEQFNDELEDDCYIFVTDERKGGAGFCAVATDFVDIRQLSMDFAKELGWDADIRHINEITFGEFSDILTRSSRKNYIDDEDKVFLQFNLEALRGRSIHFGENLIAKNSKAAIYRAAGKFLMKSDLIEEFDRIYQAPKQSIAGHPVHYMIQTDGKDQRREISRLLLSALHGANRIQSERYCFLDFNMQSMRYELMSPFALDNLYQLCTGGTIIMRIDLDTSDDGDRAGIEHGLAELVTTFAKRYRHQVLTVFCLPTGATRMKALLYELLGNIRIVELQEKPIKEDVARDYLKGMAKEYGVRSDKKLLSKIQEGESYSACELKNILDDWYDHKLGASAYPQYSSFACAEKELLKKAEKGTAYEKLQKMIGLSEAKKVIDQAVDYYKFQKLYKDSFRAANRPSMHMVFTGNPGTAKTSVARLVAAIFRENDILDGGNLVEVGRSDLVGAYVGWTAKIVKKKFEQAKGGVLFIDEAYSLVDDRKGSYGDEAINTIVQEMENHRDDVIVILAGYKKEMEHFLETNPGLNSRIAFHVPFDDYNADELTQIAKLFAADHEMKLTKEAIAKIHRITEYACKDPSFGNGRYVRNLMERAYMAQASRIISMGEAQANKKLLTTLEAEDFEMIATGHEAKKSIGFAG